MYLYFLPYSLARHIQKHQRLFTVLESLDNGKPFSESRDADVPTVVRHFYHHAGWAQLMPTEMRGWKSVGKLGPGSWGIIGKDMISQGLTKPWNWLLHSDRCWFNTYIELTSSWFWLDIFLYPRCNNFHFPYNYVCTTVDRTTFQICVNEVWQV